MLGLWNEAFKNPNPDRFGPPDSYEFAETFLQGLEVEDWGCGEARFKDFHKGKYVGVDGSESGKQSELQDLRTRKSQSEGILLRHVLEHNVDWAMILENALQSFTDTLVVVMFCPWQDETKVIANAGGIADISFSLEDFRSHFPAGTQEFLNRPAPLLQYGMEHFFVVKKEASMPLAKGKSKAAFSKNVKEEVKSGRPLKQALAIAYSAAKEKLKPKKKGR